MDLTPGLRQRLGGSAGVSTLTSRFATPDCCRPSAFADDAKFSMVGRLSLDNRRWWMCSQAAYPLYRTFLTAARRKF
jgi:hypothetical protein